MKRISTLDSVRFALNQARAIDSNHEYGGKLIMMAKDGIRDRMVRENLNPDERSQIEELFKEY